MALFSKSKGGKKEKDTLLEALKFIVKSGVESGANVPNAVFEKMEKLEPGLIAKKAGAEVDPMGNILVYATSRGIAALSGDLASNASQASNGTNGAATEAETPQFTLEQGYEAPAAKRGGIRAAIYPFDKMNVGDSFFVPATTDRPNPAKQLASTVSSATKRFKSGNRKYIVRARTAEDKGEKANGARVYRIA